VNPCSRTAPCKTFAGAISKTAPGGTISVLDPGGFGAVTITKAITIDGSNTMASALASGTNGIVVTAASTDKVILRGLDISGVSGALSGVLVNQAANVVISHCRIAGFTNAIRVQNTSNTIKVDIEATETLNSSGTAILITPTSPGQVNVALSDSYVAQAGGNGLDIASTNNKATVTRCVFRNVASAAAQVQFTSSNLWIESSTFNNNGIGVNSGVGVGNAPVTRISRCIIVGNTTGIGGTGTTVGFQNNVVVDNGGGNSVSSSVAQQ
jgi:hypothetical protein